jgi:hypothetical protein
MKSIVQKSIYLAFIASVFASCKLSAPTANNTNDLYATPEKPSKKSLKVNQQYDFLQGNTASTNESDSYYDPNEAQQLNTPLANGRRFTGINDLDNGFNPRFNGMMQFNNSLHSGFGPSFGMTGAFNQLMPWGGLSLGMMYGNPMNMGMWGGNSMGLGMMYGNPMGMWAGNGFYDPFYDPFWGSRFYHPYATGIYNPFWNYRTGFINPYFNSVNENRNFNYGHRSNSAGGRNYETAPRGRRNEIGTSGRPQQQVNPNSTSAPVGRRSVSDRINSVFEQSPSNNTKNYDSSPTNRPSGRNGGFEYSSPSTFPSGGGGGARSIGGGSGSGMSRPAGRR